MLASAATMQFLTDSIVAVLDPVLNLEFHMKPKSQALGLLLLVIVSQRHPAQDVEQIPARELA